MTRACILTLLLLSSVQACSDAAAPGEQPIAASSDAGPGQVGSAVEGQRPSIAPTPAPEAVSLPSVSTPAPTAMGAPTAAAPTAQLPQLDPRTPFAELPAECKGFEVLGLAHSPGGKVLPNLCAPFEGTYNNPYAIRCQDADPSYRTQWIGDEFCILPPPAELGIQLHAGPKSYDNPTDYLVFQLEPGAEINTTYNLKASNTEAHKFYRANYRMRSGSHHLIMRFGDENLTDGWSDQTLSEFSITDLVGNPSIQGAQRASDDRPSGMLDIPPENLGLASDLAPHQQVSMNLHHMNRFDKPILREAWVNLWYMPPEDVKATVLGMFLRGDPQDVMIPPGEHRILHYATSITNALRVVALWGHRHVSTDRFSAWLERSTGETLNLYESFDYNDQPIYQYDSVSQNPQPDTVNRVDGGYTGLVEMKPGDRLHFLCDITNQQDVTLRFANELFTGEMCILWGSRAGSGDFNTPERVRDVSAN